MPLLRDDQTTADVDRTSASAAPVRSAPPAESAGTTRPRRDIDCSPPEVPRGAQGASGSAGRGGLPWGASLAGERRGAGRGAMGDPARDR